jgi:hypothetical protein
VGEEQPAVAVADRRHADAGVRCRRGGRDGHGGRVTAAPSASASSSERAQRVDHAPHGLELVERIGAADELGRQRAQPLAGVGLRAAELDAQDDDELLVGAGSRRPRGPRTMFIAA